MFLRCQTPKSHKPYDPEFRQKIYEIIILDRGELPWSVHSREARTINAISLDDPQFRDDTVHESAKHALEQRKKYARWLDADDPLLVANAMLIIIGRALNMRQKKRKMSGLIALTMRSTKSIGSTRSTGSPCSP